MDQRNLAEYWKELLMTVSSLASLEKVTAIVSQYPSPRALLDAYHACRSVQEQQQLLANIEVRRTDSVLGGKRKVGPDVSKKIHTMLTCGNPETLIGQSEQ